MDIDWHLLARERKLWRVVDENAAKRCFYVSLVYVPFFIVIFFMGGATQVPRWFSPVIGLLGFAVICCRGILFYRFDQLHGRSPIRWRRLFMWFSFAHLMLLSLYLFLLGWFYQPPSGYFFSLSLGLIHFLLLVSAFAPFRYGITLLALTHCMPLMALALMSHAFLTPLTGVLLAIALVIILLQSERASRFVWQEKMLRRNFRRQRRALSVALNQQGKKQYLSNDFLASLSREIRTPMNNVLGMLRLISETELSLEQRRMQNIATASGENIILLIEELLDLSKIISRKLVLDSAIFNIRQCIDAAINLSSPMAYAKNTELTHISDPDIPLRVRSDARRISQVLSNVIGFIIDYTQGGEIAVNVHLTPAQVVEGVLRIHVSSKNTMIPEHIQEEVQRILNFNDNIETLSPNHLGLEIAKGVVEAMCGSLGFVASEHNGVTFWITMHLTLSTQQTFSSKTPDIFSKKRVLLIDMTKGLQASLHNDLHSWAMHVDEVQGYQKALELMRDQSRDGWPYDVAILNMALEYVGSLKLSSIMAQDPVLVNTKQIILCTVSQRGQNATLRHDGKSFPCLFLTKPFSRGNLFHALLESFEGPRVQSALEGGAQDVSIQGFDSRYRIMLVEDNKVNQMVAQGLLKKLGYRAELCETGQDALAKLKENRYDLVLMDCNLPDTDGYQVTAQYRKYEEEALGIIKSIGVERRTAIIALTANAAPGEEAKCFAAGMDDYLTKPIQADKMATRLRTWLEKAPIQSGVIHTRHASQNIQAWSSFKRGL